MKFLILLLISLNAFSQVSSNLLGGRYSSQMDASVARDNSESSIFINPAGLSKFNKESISAGASSLSILNAKEQGGSYTSQTTDSNHIAYISSSQNYNFGFLVYNSSNSKKFELSNQESESYYDNSVQTAKNEVNSYIFSFAKKIVPTVFH